MESYTIFSEVYDTLMSDIPYEKWAQNLKDIWTKYDLEPNLVLDLCCGSGTMTKLLEDNGYDMTAIDLSIDMLMKAREKCPNTLFLNQDMTNFELFGTVDSIVCLCDSMNYLLKEEDFLKTLKLCNNYLNPKGLLIFDVNAKYKFEHELSNNTFGGNYDNFSYLWENYYDTDTNINEYQTTFFIKDDDGLYEKFEEVHYEKYYSIDTITNLIEKSGLKLEGVFDENLFSSPTDKSQRIYFVCREVLK